MKLDNVFRKTRVYTKRSNSVENEPSIPDGILKKCNMCKAAIVAEDVRNANNICPKCGGYFRMHARRRIANVVDEGSFEEWDKELNTDNPSEFLGYEKKIEALREKTGLDEAIITGKASIGGNPCVIGVMDGRFMMASMGEVVGEKITRMVERATKEKLPVIIFTCSGGARMQEGIVSLMQMAKTSAALKKHDKAGLLYISVLTDPTTGGVTASFAMLGDIILAEPNALIGFAGPRVIEQTIGEKLPKGFQRSEFLLEHGFIDAIVERNNMKETLGQILSMHKISCSTDNLFAACKNEKSELIPRSTGRSAWEKVMRSRAKDRPVATDYISNIFGDFIEFHGDRQFKDDEAIIGGIATFNNVPVTVIAEAKGRDTKENIRRNFGMPDPSGYRKALRLMKQAEKFGRPIIALVDTPGAFPGLSAEERGQGEAIARNLFEMIDFETPILSVVIGEGGSGGALALAVADEVWMLENSIYSILSPEGFASILWKDSKRAAEAAETMRLTAADLYELKVIDKVISEQNNFSKENMDKVVYNLRNNISQFLAKYVKIGKKELIDMRYRRFRKF